MSNNYSCREKYFSYGSYLNSRGYDKEICNLATAIENGELKIGNFTSGSCSDPVKDNALLGNLSINPCTIATKNTSGILKVNGGYKGDPDVSNATLSDYLLQSQNYSIQGSAGLRLVNGQIFQLTDCSHSNYFGAKNHIFGEGISSSGHDCSTNVLKQDSIVPYNITYKDASNNDVTESLTYRNMNIYGEATYISKIRNPNVFTELLSTTIYSDIKPDILKNNLFNNNVIDIFNNKEAMKNMILEISITMSIEYDNNGRVEFYLIDLNNPSNIITIDSRSVAKKNGLSNIAFGPKVIVFQEGNVNSDNTFLNSRLSLRVNASNILSYGNDGRFTLKMRSIK